MLDLVTIRVWDMEGGETVSMDGGVLGDASDLDVIRSGIGFG